MQPDPTGAPLAAAEAATEKSFCTRRGVLIGAVTGAAGLAVGAPLGYKYRSKISALRAVLAPPAAGDHAARLADDPHAEFVEQARQIHERHRRQTAESVAALKKKHEHPVFGKVAVWDLIEKLGQCIDTSDPTLGGGSQYLDVQQALAAMELQGIDDPHLFLIALLH